MVHRKILKNLLFFLIKTVFSIITFLRTWCMRIQNNDITSAPLRTIYDILLLRNSTLFTGHTVLSAHYKKSCSELTIFVSFYIKKIQSSILTIHPLPHLNSCIPPKSNLYLGNSLSTVVSEYQLYRFLIFQVPNLMFLFHCLG